MKTLNEISMSNFFIFRKGLLILLAIIPHLLFGGKIKNHTTVCINFISKSSPDKIIISIILLSQESKVLKLPIHKSLAIGYEDDQNADCFFEVYEVDRNIQQIPTSDYQYFLQKKQYVNLHKGESINYKFNLSNFYNFDLNKKYKIRIKFRLSKYGLRNDIYSDWINF